MSLFTTKTARHKDTKNLRNDMMAQHPDKSNRSRREMNDSDSAALVQKIAGGDASAMMALYDRTNRILFGLVLRILPDNTPAEEALLDAYTRLWRQAGSYDPRGGTPLAWMLGIARNSAIEKMRAGSPDQRKAETLQSIPGEDSSKAGAGDDIPDVRQHLVRSASEAAPPDYIRDLLALRIEREPHAAPAAPARPPDAARLELKHASPPRPAPAPPTQRRANVIIPWLLAITCTAAAALFFFLWHQTQKRSDQALQWDRDATREARAETEQLRSQMASSTTRQREIEVLDAALAAPGLSVIYLAARRPDAGVSAVVFWEPMKNAWIVLGHLPPAPSGKDYQVWFVTGSAKRSAGLIPVDASGHGFTTIELPPDIPKFTSVDITLEPMGGSEQPTTPAIVSSRQVSVGGP